MSASTPTGGRQVTASVFGGPSDPGTGSTGYRGDNLYQHPDSFAELGGGSALGNLPYMTPVTISYNGRSVTLYKRDIGGGGPGLGGTMRAVDVWFQAAQQLGLNGLAVVTITVGQAPLVQASTAPAAACSSQAVPVGAVINDAQLGPTTDPVPGAIMSRLDMGADGTTLRFVAPFNGTVAYSTSSDSGWQGGGYVAIQASQDPSMCYYAAEGLTPTVQQGQTVTVGQVIATPRPSPYNGIAGNFEIGRCTPGNPRDPLAHHVPDPTGMVLAFERWLVSLGVPAASSVSNAGYA